MNNGPCVMQRHFTSHTC